jgi:hypothetical protein
MGYGTAKQPTTMELAIATTIEHFTTSPRFRLKKFRMI